MDLDETYRWATKQMRAVGVIEPADRMDRRKSDVLDRTPISIAIMAAVDAFGCRRAADVDRGNAERWGALARDQARISRENLLFCLSEGVEH